LKRFTNLAEAYAEICATPAPMQARLEAYASQLRHLNAPLASAYDELVVRLSAGKAGKDAPAIGDAMPPFRAPDQNGRLVSLADMIADGPLIVSCNRGNWCAFCRIELRTLTEAHERFSSMGARVVSIMPERQQFVAELVREFAPPFPILTDLDNSYALELGLTFWIGERLTALLRETNLSLSDHHGNDAWFLPIPATFVVGRDGRVKARFIDPDFRNRMEIDDIMEALRVYLETGASEWRR